MLRIDNTEVFGWNGAIRGMRNPKNSWDKSDSTFQCSASQGIWYTRLEKLGPNDLRLATILANAGTDHGKFLRMIHVQADVLGPLYWFKEYDTYKVGTVANSCSTMHKIDSRDLTMDDFSTEHLDTLSKRCIEQAIVAMNDARADFKATGDKEYWWQMIQLLPMSFNQLRTIDTNYAVLKAMYHARKNHKLDEWHTFCAWIESLPYAAELIVGGSTND